jgi:tripartite-type tricarboxylate transporter receptor subunit TctC
MTIRIRYSLVIGAACASALGAAPPAVAQEKFPSRPIEIVVPAAVGGGNDITSRILAEIMEPTLGQKLVVLNKPGAAGAFGMAAILQAKPDGYTVGSIWNAPLTMAPHLQSTLPKPGEYTPILLYTSSPTILCVKAAFPASDGKGFVEELRKNPNKYTYGNDGVGGVLHLATERVFLKLGVKARPVPFGGAGETLKNFLGDHIDIYGGSILPVLPYAKDKSAKCLMVTSAERNAAVPDAAGLAELGAPGEATALWRGMIAPKGLPADRLALLQKAFSDAALSPRFREFMQQRGEEAKGTSSAEFRELIFTEYEAMGKVMVAIGLLKK